MCTPFFSIVIPAYNTAPYLPRCVKSLLEQSFQNFEILLVDDGSTDGTGAAVDHLQAKDPRVRGFHVPHAGVSTARNSGLLLAEGEYILFVDSDDALVAPDALKRIHRSLKEAPEMLSYGLLTRSIESTESLRHSDSGDTDERYKTVSEAADDCIRGNDGFISACTHAYCLPIIREHHIRFQEGLTFGEDRLFNWNYLRYCKRISYIKDRLYIYSCDREGSGSHRFVAGMLQILMNLQAENISTMLALCSDGVSDEEKDQFRARCLFSATREAWKHLVSYYPSLSRAQRSQELKGFLALRFPGRLPTKGLRKKERLWVFGLRLAVRLRAGWLLRAFLHAEVFLYKRRGKRR